jgi:hypothetical protein
VRRFLNVNIAEVPSNWQPGLFDAFRLRDWNATLFELFVARTLQLLGASIEIETAINSTGRRPDFKASFPDSSIVVEATGARTNQRVEAQIKQNEQLVAIIKSMLPSRLDIAVWRLPDLGPSESKQNFKQAVKRLFEPYSRNNPLTPVELCEEFDSGQLLITLFPGSGSVLTHGVVADLDDTEIHIPKVFKKKKKQVREADLPVVLALTTFSMTGDLDDFDHALFGRTFERVDFREATPYVVETGFHADGLFAKRRTEAPTYAAALVFPQIGFQKVPDPVLYVNSRFEGVIPEGLLRLQVRKYDQAIGIAVQHARSEAILAQMEFVSNEV